MIEILMSTGDTAEADTPEAAMIAARTMFEDATQGRYSGRARDITATFVVDGNVVGRVPAGAIR